MSDTGENGAPNSIQFTDATKAELDSIVTASLEQFGELQTQKYIDGLGRALSLLAVFPNLGSDQGHIAIGLRRLAHC